MNWKSQVAREVKSFLVWFLIPITGLMSIIKVMLDWYTFGTASVNNVLQLLVSLIIVIVCGYSSRKAYDRRQANALSGTTEIGRVVHVTSIGHSQRDFLRMSMPVILLTILAVVLQANITSVLILLYAGVGWLWFLSTFVVYSQCMVGTQGLSTAFMGLNFFVPYSSINKVLLRSTVNSERVQMTLYVKNVFPSRFDLPTPLDQKAIEALKEYITVEIPTNLST